MRNCPLSGKALEKKNLGEELFFFVAGIVVSPTLPFRPFQHDLPGPFPGNRGGESSLMAANGHTGGPRVFPSQRKAAETPPGS